MASTATKPITDFAADFASTASGTMSSAVDGLARGAETQKNAGADALAGFARSVKDSADTLESQSPQVARAVRLSAEKVEQLSHDLKAKDVNELLDATTAFARRQPVVFLGLGVIAGIVLVRALANSR